MVIIEKVYKRVKWQRVIKNLEKEKDYNGRLCLELQRGQEVLIKKKK